ncbi:MAG: hypothetical protein WCK67_07880 [bacterium]
MTAINSLNQFAIDSLADPTPVNDNFETLRVSNNDIESRTATIENSYIKKDGSVKSTGLQSYKPLVITGATNTTPIVITSTNHARVTGDSLSINGVLGNTASNGNFIITVIDANTFSLNGSVGNGAYISGGIGYLNPNSPENLATKGYIDKITTSKGLVPQCVNVARLTNGQADFIGIGSGLRASILASAFNLIGNGQYKDIQSKFTFNTDFNIPLDAPANATSTIIYKNWSTTPAWEYNASRVYWGSTAPAFSGSSSPSYTNPYGSGDRRGSIVFTTDVTAYTGAMSNLIDGSQADSLTINNALTSRYMKFQFPTAQVITEAKWYQSGNDNHGTWQWQGSNDNSNWTNIGATFTLGGGVTTQVQTTLSGNTNGYTYYRLLQTGGQTSSLYYAREIEFKTVASSALVDAYWFDTANNVMKYGRSATSWTEVQECVALGEVTTNGSAVVNAISYALNGKYDSGWFSISNNGNYSKSHNIGHSNVKVNSIGNNGSMVGEFAKSLQWNGSANISCGAGVQNITDLTCAFKAGAYPALIDFNAQATSAKFIIERA